MGQNGQLESEGRLPEVVGESLNPFNARKILQKRSEFFVYISYVRTRLRRA
jgi:hypothetical protein